MTEKLIIPKERKLVIYGNIFFFVSIIALIVIVLFTINPITRAVNNGIAKHNLAAEKRRQKEKESKRIENELESLRREAEELREKLKLETEINSELRKENTKLHSRKMPKEVIPEVVDTFLDDCKVYAPGDEDEYRFYDGTTYKKW